MPAKAQVQTARPMPEPEFFSEAAIPVLQKYGVSQVSAYQELVKFGLHADACRWVATHFPVRHAVWWGLMCVIDMGATDLDEMLTGLLTNWVQEPSEALQAQLLNLTWLDTPESPLEFLAKAVSWTGPSMLPMHLPATAPKPEHVGRMIAAAVDLAANGHGILEPAEAYGRFLDLARAVDDGTLNWENSAALASKPGPVSKPQGLFPSL